MSFEGIVQIAQEDNTVEVNKMLDQGWELLAITPNEAAPIYTVGRRAQKKAPMEGFVLGEHAKQG